MYELIQVSQNCYYIQSPARIGIVRTGGDEVVLIDSGSDRDAGRKVRSYLTWLHGSGRLAMEIEDDTLVWRRTGE